MRRRLAGLSAMAVLTACSVPVSAKTVEGCVLPPMTNLGRLPQSAVQARFANMAEGSVSVGGAQRVHVRVTGCAANARYRLLFRGPLRVTNGNHVLVLWPVVTAVNGSPVGPLPIARGNSGVELVGNPELELVFAVDRTKFDGSLADGTWSGTAFAIFEDM